MKLIDVLVESSKQLEEYGIESPYFEAEYLLAFILGKNRLFVKTHTELEISDSDFEEYKKIIALRCRDYPAAYITKVREFYGMEFFVTDDVLIPRPETELIIETTLKHIKTPNPIIADIGTGSGAIAIVLGTHLVSSNIFAVDISEHALRVAAINAKKHNLNDQINFIKSDYLSKIKHMTFDIIVSNPPYIKTDDIDGLQKGVKDYEPRVALDGGFDGLDAYRRIIPDSLDILNNNGFIVLEIASDQRDDIMRLADENKAKAEVFKDIYKNDRVALIEKL